MIETKGGTKIEAVARMVEDPEHHQSGVRRTMTRIENGKKSCYKRDMTGSRRMTTSLGGLPGILVDERLRKSAMRGKRKIESGISGKASMQIVIRIGKGRRTGTRRRRGRERGINGQALKIPLA